MVVADTKRYHSLYPFFFRRKSVILLSKLIEMDFLKEAKIIGGKQGIEHNVRWIHQMYDVNIGPWICENDLIYTNGACFSAPEENLISIITQLNDVNASGILVEIGKYINVISPKVVALADELNIPLIEMKSSVDIDEISLFLSYSNIDYDDKTKIREAVRRIAILPNYIGDNMNDETLRKLVFPYIALAISCENKVNSTMLDWRMNKQVMSKLSEIYGVEEQDIIDFECDEKKIYLISVDTLKKNIKQFFGDTNCKLSEKIGKSSGINAKIGISTFINDMEDISNGVHQAICANDYLHIAQSEEIYMYDEMGIFRLFYEYKNDIDLHEIYMSIMENLLAYDKDGQMYTTLEVYYSMDCNMARTADELYIHKNTLKYRLSKIKEILGMDFDEPNHGFTVQMALKIGKYLSK